MSNQQPPGYPPGQGYGPPPGYPPGQGYGPPPGYPPGQGYGPPQKPPSTNKGWKIAGYVVGGIILLRVVGCMLGLNPPPRQQASTSNPVQVANEPKPQSEPRPQPRPQPQPSEEEKAVMVPIGELLGNYKDNEIRGDAAYKDKWIQTTGFVGDVKKDILGSIYVTIGTGAEFEIPTVQCFFDDSQTQAVSLLSKGNKITVKGRVSGLMMNVLVKKCSLVK